MMNPFKSKIIAHRGESHDAPENTLASINLAWQRNVKAVEIDIRLTRDNEIVVIHDSNTQRVSGIKKTIKNTTLDVLKLLDAGSYKGQEWKDEIIPTLKQVLNTIPHDGKLIIEIKSNLKILYELKRVLSSSGTRFEQIEIIGFNINTLSRAKKMMPEYRMLWLLNLDYSIPTWFAMNNSSKIIKKIEKHNLDGVNVWAGKLLTKNFITEIKKRGYSIYAWTVNDPDKAALLIKHGLDGITTDRAAWMLDQLK
ncbi:MAG: hypothetical protein HQ521_19830 [Bacteroidetes bacterium]|nr:hypothetical protein [Bacteroidota bacterium]